MILFELLFSQLCQSIRRCPTALLLVNLALLLNDVFLDEPQLPFAMLVVSFAPHTDGTWSSCIMSFDWAIDLFKLLVLRMAEQIESADFRLFVNACIMLVVVRSRNSIISQRLVVRITAIAVIFEASNGFRQVH